MGHRALAVLAVFIAACGLSITGMDATSAEATGPDGGGSVSSSGSDGSSIDTTTEGGASDDDDDDDDGGAIVATDDAGGDDDTTIFDGGTTEAGTATCNPTATIFWDSDDGNKDSATGLQAAMLANHQFTDVELGGTIGSYTGGGGASDPNGKGVVIILTGHSYDLTMPMGGQTAIADQIANHGVGLVTSEWFPVIFDSNTDPLAQFSLVTSNHEIDYAKVKVVFTDSTFWSGPGTDFTTAVRLSFHDESPRANVTTNASASISVGPQIATRPILFSAQRGATRIAHSTFAINYPPPQYNTRLLKPNPPPPPPDDSLEKDANMKTMFVAMAAWAAHCRD